MIIKCKGSSMLPTILDEEEVDIDCKSSPQIGDIILFRNNGNMILHRLIYKTGKYMLSCGDNSHFFDYPILLKEYIGKVRGVQEHNVINLISKINIDKVKSLEKIKKKIVIVTKSDFLLEKDSVIQNFKQKIEKPVEKEKIYILELFNETELNNFITTEDFYSCFFI